MMHSIQRYSLVLATICLLTAERYYDLLFVSAFFQHPSTSINIINSISNSRVAAYNIDDRQVAILLPEVPNYVNLDSIDNNPKDHKDDLQWHTDAISRLNEIANQFGLRQLSTIDDSTVPSKEQQIQYTNTHYLTTIPYPRTSSYALSISTLEQPTSSNKSRRQRQSKKKKLKLTEPFYIDLHPPPDSILGYRMNNKQKNSGSEMLIKALGIKKLISEKKMNKEANNQEEVIVYDLTAGLGRDTLVILSSYLDYIDNSNGNSDEDIPRLRVHMVERDPIVALLLNDGMRRLHQLASSNQIEDDERSKAQRITQCLSMEEGDGVTVLNRLKMLDKDKESSATPSDSSCSIISTPSYPPDVCYLDPMFPPRKKKSSAVKKDMALLHSLLGTAVTSVVKEGGEDDDEIKNRIHEEQALLLAAYKTAIRRVVVKRPISALPLGLVVDNSDCDNSTDDDRNIPKPSYDVRGSVNRFDVYIIT